MKRILTGIALLLLAAYAVLWAAFGRREYRPEPDDEVPLFV